MRIEGSGSNINRYQTSQNQNSNFQIGSEQEGISGGRGRRIGRQENVQGAQRSMAMPSEESYSQDSQDSELSNVLGQDEYIPNQQIEGQQGRFRNPTSLREGRGQENRMGRFSQGEGQENGINSQDEQGHQMRMPRMGREMGGMRRPMGHHHGIGHNQEQMPNLEELFSKIDQDGNGSVTKEELQSYIKAQQAAETSKTSASSEATSSETSETSASSEATSSETAVASDPTEIKNNVLANLTAMTQSDDYASLSDTEKQQIEAAIEAVNSLDPNDAQFMEKLQAMFGGSSSSSSVSETSDTTETTDTSETLDPSQIKEQVLANLTAMTQSSDYESLSDTEKQQISDTIEAVNGLDTSDSQFIEKLQTVLGLSSSTDSN